jgi:EmrB/QacA subfamily drug resistance transporter
VASMTTTSPTTTAPGRTAGAAGSTAGAPWPMLALLLVGQFMALLDATIVNVAMPTIGGDLHASGATLQLVVSGYTISYAVLLITGARLGDIYGRRRLYQLGLLGFTASSLLCGVAPDTAVLVAARFVQGTAAALMVPQIMSVIQMRFTGAARAKALSAYSSVLAAGGVTGQVVGGVLVSADLFGTGWRPVFLVNVPIGLAVAVLVPRMVPADVAGGTRRLDLWGLATLVPAVLLVVLPLVLGHEEDWPAWTFASMAAGLALIGVFVAVERRVADRGGDPLLNLRVLRAPGIVSGLLTLSAAMITYGGFLFCLALHLQSGLGESALRAGLTFAPAALTFGLGGMYWSRLPTRVHHLLTPIGFLIAAGGYASLALNLRGGTDGGTRTYVVMLVTGVGYGLAFSPLLQHALVKVPMTEAADASGLLTTTLQLSQVIGIAAFGTLYFTLVNHPATHPSAHAFATTIAWLAVLMLIGVLGAAALARTVIQARRQPASSPAA